MQQMKETDAQQKQEIPEVVKMLQKMRGKQSAADRRVPIRDYS